MLTLWIVISASDLRQSIAFPGFRTVTRRLKFRSDRQKFVKRRIELIDKNTYHTYTQQKFYINHNWNLNFNLKIENLVQTHVHMRNT
jgi:hypothetical protein